MANGVSGTAPEIVGGAQQSSGTRVDRRGARTRRRVLGGTAAIGALALSAAWGAGGAAPATSGGTPAEQPGKLLVKIRSGANYDGLFRDGIALFRQKFPKTEIDYFPEESGWQEKLMAGWAAGNGADVYQAWDDNFWRFVANGAVVNINDLLKDFKKGDLDDFVKGQWNGFQIPGTNIRFGLPTYINMGVLYVNNQSFAKAGVKVPDANWTYNDYAEITKRLTRMENGRQIYGGYHPLGKGRTENTLWAFGGGFIDPKDFTKSITQQPEAQQALDWLYDRYWKDQSWINLKQRPANFAMQTSLADGLLATAEDGMHALTRVAPIDGVDFDVVSLPKGPKQRMTWITTDGWGMWSGTKSKAQAWEFTKFLASPEWYKMQTRADLLIPSRISLLDDWMQVVRSRYPSLEKVNLKGVKEQLMASPPTVSTWPQFLCAADANKVIGDTLNEVYVDGTAKPSVFRDRKPQIDAAASGCGMVIK